MALETGSFIRVAKVDALKRDAVKLYQQGLVFTQWYLLASNIEGY